MGRGSSSVSATSTAARQLLFGSVAARSASEFDITLIDQRIDDGEWRRAIELIARPCRRDQLELQRQAAEYLRQVIAGFVPNTATALIDAEPRVWNRAVTTERVTDEHAWLLNQLPGVVAEQWRVDTRPAARERIGSLIELAVADHHEQALARQLVRQMATTMMGSMTSNSSTIKPPERNWLAEQLARGVTRQYHRSTGDRRSWLLSESQHDALQQFDLYDADQPISPRSVSPLSAREQERIVHHTSNTVIAEMQRLTHPAFGEYEWNQLAKQAHKQALSASTTVIGERLADRYQHDPITAWAMLTGYDPAVISARLQTPLKTERRTFGQILAKWDHNYENIDQSLNKIRQAARSRISQHLS